MKRYRFFRRMRVHAYEDGYADGFLNALEAAPRPSPLGGLLRATGAIGPEQDAWVDPFPASDWREPRPTPGRPTCSHGYEAGSPHHVCAELPSDYAR